jgi:hypothetical protein
MSNSEINKAKLEAEQSNQKLESALNHFKDAVGDKAEVIGEKKDRFNHLFEEKKQTAQHLVDNSFKGAEDFLKQQTDMLKNSLTSIRSETDNFLGDVESSLDRFVKNVRNSVSSVLDITEDRRLISMVSLFLAGFISGGLLGRRLVGRASGTIKDIEQERGPFTEQAQEKVRNAA